MSLALALALLLVAGVAATITIALRARARAQRPPAPTFDELMLELRDSIKDAERAIGAELLEPIRIVLRAIGRRP